MEQRSIGWCGAGYGTNFGADLTCLKGSKESFRMH
jgi:hypothetical protein